MDPQPRGPDWMQITPKAGSLFHAKSQRDATYGKMSAAQALEILGINAGATEQDIRPAHKRLVKRVHPDVGGSEYFSKQLNAARDMLLRQLRAGA